MTDHVEMSLREVMNAMGDCRASREYREMQRQIALGLDVQRDGIGGRCILWIPVAVCFVLLLAAILWKLP